MSSRTCPGPGPSHGPSACAACHIGHGGGRCAPARASARAPAAGAGTAGDGSFGFAGDGGLATAAQLREPSGVALTPEGGILIADASNHRVRFVDADLRGPGAGPQGPAGAVGPTGPAGPAGAPGARAVFERLLLAAVADRLSARPGSRVTLCYVATVAARVDLAVLRGTRAVAHVRGRAKPGRNALRVRVPRRAGSYTLALTAQAADQRAGDRVRLTVRVPRRA
jgi:hypothetical protein